MSLSIFLLVISWAYAIAVFFALVQSNTFQDAVATQQFRRQVRHLVEPFIIVAGYGDAGRSSAPNSTTITGDSWSSTNARKGSSRSYPSNSPSTFRRSAATAPLPPCSGWRARPPGLRGCTGPDQRRRHQPRGGDGRLVAATGSAGARPLRGKAPGPAWSTSPRPRRSTPTTGSATYLALSVRQPVSTNLCAG